MDFVENNNWGEEMGKLLSTADLEYLDNLIAETKEALLSTSSESEKNLKKAFIKALDTNEYSKNWRFPMKYAALKHLKLV